MTLYNYRSFKARFNGCKYKKISQLRKDCARSCENVRRRGIEKDEWMEDRNVLPVHWEGVKGFPSQR